MRGSLIALVLMLPLLSASVAAADGPCAAGRECSVRGVTPPAALPPSIVFRAEVAKSDSSASVAVPREGITVVGITADASPGALPTQIRLSAGAHTFSLELGPKVERASFELPPFVAAEAIQFAFRAAAAPFTLTVHTSDTPEALVRALAGRGDERLRAIALLPRLGSKAVDALEAAFETLTPRERRDALKVYARLARDPRARARLIEASTDADPEVRAWVADALEGAALVEAARRGSAEAFAKAARTVPEQAFGLALERLAGEPPYTEARKVLRTLAEAIDADALLVAIAAVPPVVRARAVEPLVESAALRERLLSPLTVLLEGAQAPGEALDDEAFETLYRATRASAAYSEAMREPLEPSLLRLTTAHEWMLRAAAFRALGALGAAREVFTAGLADPYPRVRLAALAALLESSDRGEVDEVFRALAKDPFPLVRAEAVTLAAREGVLVGAVDDRSPRVRLAVLTSWLGRDERAADLDKALRRERRLDVKGGFLEAAAARCVPGFERTAQQILEVAGPGQDEAASAAALSYLLAFEGETREAWIRALEARGVPKRTLEGPPRCRGKIAL